MSTTEQNVPRAMFDHHTDSGQAEGGFIDTASEADALLYYWIAQALRAGRYGEKHDLEALLKWTCDRADEIKDLKDELARAEGQIAAMREILS